MVLWLVLVGTYLREAKTPAQAANQLLEAINTRLAYAHGHGNSRAHCLTQQPLPEAIAAIRAEIVNQQLTPSVV